MTEIATREMDALDIAMHGEELRQLGEMLLSSRLLPESLKTPEAVVAVVLKGREIGIGPMQALDSIDVIQGNPTISAELMRALIQRAGHKFRVLQTTTERCVVEGVRRDDPGHAMRLAYTIEDAKRAGVASKDNYKKHPDSMLLARATTRLGRAMFADVIAGCSYAPEELGEVPPELPSGLSQAEVEGFSGGARLEAKGEVEGEVEGEVVDEATGEVLGEAVPIDSPGFDPEHDKWRTEVERVYYRIPVDTRPAYGKVQRAADRGTRAAKEALRRLRVLAAEAGTLPANSLDPDKDYSDGELVGEAGSAGEEEAEDAG